MDEMLLMGTKYGESKKKKKRHTHLEIILESQRGMNVQSSISILDLILFLSHCIFSTILLNKILCVAQCIECGILVTHIIFPPIFCLLPSLRVFLNIWFMPTMNWMFVYPKYKLNPLSRMWWYLEGQCEKDNEI